MNPEQPSMPSQEQMAKTEKERVLSDAELLQDGAEYEVNEQGEKRLEVTSDQIEKIKQEHSNEQKSKEPKPKEVDKISHELEQSQEEGPKLKLPEDAALVKAFNNKLAEYKARLASLMTENPEQPPEAPCFTDVTYKIAVLETLLAQGEIDTYDVGRQLIKTHGGLNIGVFENACRVIDDYIKTGGKNATNGTGIHIERANSGSSPEIITESIATQLTPENVQAALEREDPIKVKVLRTSGVTEDGWVITGIDTPSDIAIAIVFKLDGKKLTLRKEVPLAELIKWNS